VTDVIILLPIVSSSGSKNADLDFGHHDCLLNLYALPCLLWAVTKDLAPHRNNSKQTIFLTLIRSLLAQWQRDDQVCILEGRSRPYFLRNFLSTDMPPTARGARSGPNFFFSFRRPVSYLYLFVSILKVWKRRPWHQSRLRSTGSSLQDFVLVIFYGRISSTVHSHSGINIQDKVFSLYKEGSRVSQDIPRKKPPPVR